MLLLEIKPEKYNTYNCLESTLVTVAKYFKSEYKLMFLDSWGFKFIPLSSASKKYINFGERLHDGIQGDFDIILEKYYGISIFWNKSDRFREVLKIVYKELNSRYPIAINIDAFWCNWTRTYKRIHASHFILVIGLDEEHKEFICSDSYCNDNFERISFEELKKGIIMYCTFRRKKISKKFEIKEFLIKELTNKFTCSLHGNQFTMIKMFADEFENLFDLKNEIRECKDIYAITILRKLKEIADGRKNFSQSLKELYLIDKDKNLLVKSKEIENIAKIWEGIRVSIMKAIIKCDFFDKKKIAEKISEIAIYEEEFANELLDILI